MTNAFDPRIQPAAASAACSAIVARAAPAPAAGWAAPPARVDAVVPRLLALFVARPSLHAPLWAGARGR